MTLEQALDLRFDRGHYFGRVEPSSNDSET